MRNDAFGAVSELAAAQHGVFSRGQAASVGLTRNRIVRLIAAGVLEEPRPGVYLLRGAPHTWQQLLAVDTALDHVFASHRAAARVHDLDGCRAFDHIEVSSERYVRSPGGVAHRAHLPPIDLVVVDGIPTTNLARTLCDLGDVVPAGVVERALDDARRRGTSLRWLCETAERLHRPGVSGPATLRRLLRAIEPDVRVRDSWFEKVVELILRDPSLPAVVRQHELRNSVGGLVARFDLAMPSLRLGFEAHSREFHFGRAAETRDEDRDHRIAACGWDTVYLGWSATRRPSETLRLVREIVEARSRASAHGFGS